MARSESGIALLLKTPLPDFAEFAIGPAKGRTLWRRPGYVSMGSTFFESTRIHRSRPDAEVCAALTAGPRPFASTARAARQDTDLLEPIFQRKFMLALRLGAPADRRGLASICQI
jgi:hypothetical protein